MTLNKCISIEVISNEIEKKEKIRRQRVKFINEIPLFVEGNAICIICNNIMDSPYGIYNGSWSSDGDEDKGYKSYSYECDNFHNYTWNEEM